MESEECEGACTRVVLGSRASEHFAETRGYLFSPVPFYHPCQMQPALGLQRFCSLDVVRNLYHQFYSRMKHWQMTNARNCSGHHVMPNESCTWMYRHTASHLSLAHFHHEVWLSLDLRLFVVLLPAQGNKWANGVLIKIDLAFKNSHKIVECFYELALDEYKIKNYGTVQFYFVGGEILRIIFQLLWFWMPCHTSNSTFRKIYF